MATSATQVDWPWFLVVSVTVLLHQSLQRHVVGDRRVQNEDILPGLALVCHCGETRTPLRIECLTDSTQPSTNFTVRVRLRKQAWCHLFNAYRIESLFGCRTLPFFLVSFDTGPRRRVRVGRMNGLSKKHGNVFEIGAVACIPSHHCCHCIRMQIILELALRCRPSSTSPGNPCCDLLLILRL